MFLRAAVFLGLTFLAALPCGAAQITLSLGSIRHPAFEAEGVSVAFDAARRGEADIRLGRLKIAGTEYRELRLHCSGFFFDGRRLDCPNGALQREDERGRNRPALPFSLAWRAGDGFLDFSMRDVDAVAFSPLVKRLRGWKPAGKIDFAILVEGARAKLDLAVRDLDFASREGDIAGKGIAFTLNAGAERNGAGWHWHARLDWPEGELFRAPWRRQAGVRMEAEGDLTDTMLEVGLARLDVAGTGGVTAGLRWNRALGEATDWGFITDRIDLAAALRDWLQPWLTSLGLPEWQASGHALFSAEWKARELRRFYAGLEEARLADGTGHLELNGVNARIPWEEGVPTDAEITIAAGRLGDLPLGSFTLPLRIDGSEAKVEGLTAPMLDGRFLVDELRLAKSQSGWHGEFEGGIEGVSMPKLSRALRMPAMAGSLTARVPRIAYEQGVLHLDGALGIEVFDGGITVHQLRLVDPFGKGRRFVADVTARNLDLGMLTRTFAFGSIEGRFDADLHDLELAGWKPVRFDAHIASSEGNYPRSLSLGALKDITALGETGSPQDEQPSPRPLPREGGDDCSPRCGSKSLTEPSLGRPGGWLARAPERSGFSFGYSRIGFGCALRNGVCLLEGVEREGDGVVLMRGSGMPSVSIIGYNRHIDWEALLARIREVIAGRPGVVIE